MKGGSAVSLFAWACAGLLSDVLIDLGVRLRVRVLHQLGWEESWAEARRSE